MAPKVVDQDPDVTDSEEDKSPHTSKSPLAKLPQSTDINIQDDHTPKPVLEHEAGTYQGTY